MIDKKSFTPTLVIFLITFVVTAFVYSAEFMRLADDSKELSLYFGSLVLGLFFLLSRKKFSLTQLHVLIALFLLYGVVRNAMASHYQFEGLASWGELFFLFVLFLCLSSQNSSSLKDAGKVIVLITGLSSLWVLIQFALNGFAMKTATSIYPFGNVSFLSNSLLPVLFLAAFFYLKERKTAVLYLMAFFILFFCYWLAATRSSFLGFSAGMFFLLLGFAIKKISWSSFKKAKAKIALLVVGVVLIVGLSEWQSWSFRKASLMSRITHVEEAQKKNEANTLKSRLQLYQATLTGSLQKPVFGWGYGSFVFAYPQFIQGDFIEKSFLEYETGKLVSHPHNELLNHFFEGGFIGLLFCLAIIGFLFRHLWKQNSSESHFLMAVFVSLTIALQLDTSAQNAFVRMVLVFLVAWSMGVLQLRELKQASHKTMVVFLVIGLLISSYFTMGQFAASYYLKQAMREVSLKQEPKSLKVANLMSPNTFRTVYYSGLISADLKKRDDAIRYLVRGAELYPHMTSLHFNLGRLFLETGNLPQAELSLKYLKDVTPLSDRILVLEEWIQSYKDYQAKQKAKP